MLAALKHNLTRLADFKGRDTRSQFWPWTGCVMASVMAVWFVAVGSVMTATMGRMQAYAEAHPEQATVTTVGRNTSIVIEGSPPGLVPDFSGLFGVMGGIVVAVVVLLAAAVARRLHDRGRSAFWGLAPLPFLAFGLIAMHRMMGQFTVGAGEPDGTLFTAIFLNNIVYLAVLLTLIIQLSGAGRAEPNRFGPPVG